MSLMDELGLRPISFAPPARLVRWFVSTRFGAWTLSGTLPHLDRGMLRVSGGRTTVSDLLGGVPTILLTTTGARSGRPRISQLIAVPDGDGLAVLGSNFGQPRAPLWVKNLLAHRQAIAAHRGRQVPVVAEEAVGADAERIWVAARSAYRGFVTYPDMVGEREIKVFRLTAAPSSSETP